jgi:hypothetical protein
MVVVEPCRGREPTVARPRKERGRKGGAVLWLDHCKEREREVSEGEEWRGDAGARCWCRRRGKGNSVARCLIKIEE